MYKHYLKQWWTLIKQNRFYTTVYITGTTLAITMTMVMAIVYHIRTANIAPESNRDRMLIVAGACAENKVGGGQHNWSLSYQTLKECYYTLQKPKFVAAGVNTNSLSNNVGDFYTSVPGSNNVFNSFIYYTDAAFFKVFDFTFISGKPYSEEEFQSGMHCAILSKTLAYKLFETDNALNNTILINDVEFTVTGVVNDVSPVLNKAYAELWVPYSSNPAVIDINGGGGIVGSFSAFILADKKEDFPLIREDIEQSKKKYNTSIAEWEYIIKDDAIMSAIQSEIRKLDRNAKFRDIIFRYGIIAFIFLLVPAVNLSGITSSHVQERIDEFGIRKVFGATRNALINQILTENFLLTLLGGLTGLIISGIIVYYMRELLLGEGISMMSGTEINISFSMLYNFWIFGFTFIICLILNVFSAIIPVWNVTRRPIIQSINNNNNF